MGFRYKAHIQFDQMTLSDEAAEKNLLIQLADRDIISHETLLERFKEIPQIENIRIKRELAKRYYWSRKSWTISSSTTSMIQRPKNRTKISYSTTSRKISLWTLNATDVTVDHYLRKMNGPRKKRVEKPKSRRALRS